MKMLNKPKALFTTGIFGNESVLDPVIPFFSGWCSIYPSSLPGHGKIPLPAHLGRASWARAILDHWAHNNQGQTLDLIIGESLAATMSLWMNDFLQRPLPLVLLDPVFAPAKLFYLRHSIFNIGGPDFLVSAARKLSETWLGYDLQGDADIDIVHYEKLEEVNAPILILTGDVHLWPLRKIDGFYCCLDNTDRYILSKFPNVTVREVSNSDHTVARRQPAQVSYIIREWYKEVAQEINS